MTFWLGKKKQPQTNGRPAAPFPDPLSAAASACPFGSPKNANANYFPKNMPSLEMLTKHYLPYLSWPQALYISQALRSIIFSLKNKQTNNTSQSYLPRNA